MKLADDFFALKAEKDQINLKLKSVNERLESAEKELLLWMEAQDLEQIRTEDGTLFTRTEVYARIENEEQAFHWLSSNGMTDIIKRTVHAKTLSSLAKEHQDIPGVAVSLVTKIGHRKAAG